MKSYPPMKQGDNGFFNFMQTAIALYESEEEWENIPLLVEVFDDETIDNTYGEGITRVPVKDIVWDQDTASVIIKLD